MSADGLIAKKTDAFETLTQSLANNNCEIIEIYSSDEEEDGIHRPRNMKNASLPVTNSFFDKTSPGSTRCSHCKATFTGLVAFQAHFLDNSDCFSLMTRPYLVVTSNHTWKCGVCESRCTSEKNLEEHCFVNTTCKLTYITMFTGDFNNGKGINGCLQSHTTPSGKMPPPNFFYSNNSTDMPNSGTQPMELEHSQVGNASQEHQSTAQGACATAWHEDGATAWRQDEVTETHKSVIRNKQLLNKRTNGENFIGRDAANTSHFNKAEHDNQSSPTFPRRVLRKQLRSSKNPKDHLSCEGCLRHFTSSKELKKHQLASARCKKIIKQLENISKSCVICDQVFETEASKYVHIITSQVCKESLKKTFEDGNFHMSSDFFQICATNSSMCHYCRFTPDNGDIFSHLLHAKLCRETFEKAIIWYTPNLSSEDSSLPSGAIDNEQAQFKEFACDDCEKRFYTKRSLKSHIARKHSCNRDNRASLEQGTESNIPKCEHLFCFKCKTYLKTGSDVLGHACRSQRLLSRFCKSRAVWKDGHYQCKICHELFFNNRYTLRQHMHAHDKNRSRLFSFIPPESKQQSPKTRTTVIGKDTVNGIKQNQQAVVVNKVSFVECGHCLGMFSGKEFKHHVLTVNACFEFYDHPRNMCPMEDSGCYICAQTA